MKPRGQVADFRVHLPERGSAHWHVRIFDTADNLRAFYGGPHIPGRPCRDTAGVVGFARALICLKPGQKRYKPDPKGRRGLVVLCLSHCGVGVVSHEWTHAAFYEMTSHRKRKALPVADDEAFAMLQGELVRRFWVAFQARFKQRGRRWVRA